MKTAITPLVSVFILCLLGAGCNKSAEPDAATPTNTQSFASVAKQQRWEEANQAMKEHAGEVVARFQTADASLNLTNHWTTAQFQNYMDDVARKATGKPNVTSCRKAVPGSLNFDPSACPLDRLTVELFEESERVRR